MMEQARAPQLSLGFDLDQTGQPSQRMQTGDGIMGRAGTDKDGRSWAMIGGGWYFAYAGTREAAWDSVVAMYRKEQAGLWPQEKKRR